MRTILQILRDESGQSPFWGGLFTGLNSGMQQASEMQRRKEALKLEQQKIKIAEQEAAMRGEQFKNLVKQQAMIHGIANDLLQPQQELAPGVTFDQGGQFAQAPMKQSAAPSTVMQTKPAGLRERMLAAQLIGGHGLPASVFSNTAPQDLQGQIDILRKNGLLGETGGGGNPGGITMVPSLNPKSGVSLRGQMPREFGDVGNKAAQDWLQKHPGDINGAIEAAAGAKKTVAGKTAEGSAGGKLNVTKSPEYLQNQTDVAAAKTAGGALPSAVEDTLAKGQTLTKTIADIRANFNPDYLGPIRGTDLAFEARRRAGGLVGARLGDQETRFRQGLADARNQIVYLQSGKQINESEAARLNAALPNATDEPQVFLSGLQRFEDQMNNILGAHKQMGTTTRGQLGGQQPRRAPKILSITPIQ